MGSFGFVRLEVGSAWVVLSVDELAARCVRARRQIVCGDCDDTAVVGGTVVALRIPLMIPLAETFLIPPMIPFIMPLTTLAMIPLVIPDTADYAIDEATVMTEIDGMRAIALKVVYNISMYRRIERAVHSALWQPRTYLLC